MATKDSPPTCSKGAPEKREQTSALALSEKDEKLIGAYLDGELTESEEFAFQARLHSGETGLQQAVEAQQALRRELREYHQQLFGQADSASVDALWASIESTIQKEAVRATAVARTRATSLSAMKLGTMKLGTMKLGLSTVTSFLKEFVQPRFLFGLASGMAVVLFAMSMRPEYFAPRVAQEKNFPQDAKFALNDFSLENKSQLILSSSEEDEVPNPPILLSGNAVPEDILTKVGFDEIPMRDHTLALQGLRSPQLIVENEFPGGLRTSGSDIAWRSSVDPSSDIASRSVLGGKRENTPPVVWVANSGK